jgi:hypothetical protein
MALYVINQADQSTHQLFPASPVFSNMSASYCSYYTTGSNVPSTATQFLAKLNFSNVYANLQSGIASASALVTGNTSFIASTAVTSYITALTGDVQQLAYVAHCIAEQNDATDSLYSNTKQLAVSKDRYEQLHFPETHVSYYEGTFPIYRPIGQSTLFILFGVGLFLMLLSILFFLRTQGVEIQLIMPQTTVLSGISTVLVGQTTHIAMAAIFGIVLGYLVHVYYT